MSGEARPLPKLFPKPLPPGERGLLSRALEKAGIAAGDVEAPRSLFWRFEMPDGIPVGYGGLVVHNKEALLRAVLTLPPARGRGVGRAILAALETEAFIAGCARMWVAPQGPTAFFADFGYVPGDGDGAPDAIRREVSAALDGDGAAPFPLVKNLR